MSHEKSPAALSPNAVSAEIVEFRRISGQKVSLEEPLHAKLAAMVLPHFAHDKQQELLKTREIQKPDWFLATESEARSFMSSLGFHGLAEIHLVEGHLAGPLSGQNVEAYHNNLSRDILASEAKMAHMLQSEGINCVASVLVHELTHDTAPQPERIVLQQHTDSSSYEYRRGWITVGKNGDKGDFLEEGLCEYVAGLYRRQKAHPDGQLLPAGYAPTQALPSHLKTEAVVAGPDAHTLELMAWGVENRGIMTAESFIERWFDSRKNETLSQATREIITAINSLSPGLYPYLRNIQYSRENWITARNTVYEIVTRH